MSKWNKKPLFKIADIRLSNVDKKILDGEIPVRLCNYMDAYSNDYLDGNIPYSQGSVKLSEIDRFGLMRGDVLITKDSETPDDIAVPAVVIDDLEKVICGYHLAILRSKNDVLDGVFLMNALKEYSTRQWFIRKANGITRYGLSKSSIENAEINYPDIARQRKIARILIKVDKVIKQTEKSIEKLKKIKQGMMHDLFTRGIDVKTGKLRPPYSEAPELYKETELGWIPKEWYVVHVRDIASVKGGKRLPAGEEFSETPTDYPYIRVSDMKDGWVDMNNLVYVKPEIEQIIRNYKISKNDIYITIAGTLGQVGIIPNELDNAQLTENAAKIVFNDLNEFNKQYVKYFFWSDLFPSQLFKEIGVGGGVPKLALHRIEKFLITNPLKKEQDVVSNRFVAFDNRLQNELKCLSKAKDIKQGLMQDLLTGKVEVTPDPQDKEYQEVS